MAELKVTITDERGEQTTTSVAVQQETTDPTKANQQATPKTPEAKENGSKSNGMAIAAMVASRSFNYATSNVGKWTGNKKNQTAVNNAMQIGNTAMLACVNPYIAASSVAVNLATTAIDNWFDQRNEKRASDARLAKAGYNSAGEVVGRRH